MDAVALIVGLGFLGFASWHDLRTREVPDLVSFGPIFLGVALGLAAGLREESWLPVLRTLFGAAAAAAIGFGLYLLGQWGGADAKLLLGLGALLGLGFGRYELPVFLALLLVAGALYGILYTAWLVLRDRNRFAARFKKLLREPLVHRLRWTVVGGCFLLLGLALLRAQERPVLLLAASVIYLLFYLWLGVRAAEDALLIKEYPVGKLTEGDWILRDVVVKGERVCGPKDHGISEAQIAKLKRLGVKKVWVKEGIPFVPSFLLAYALLWLFGAQLVALLPF